MHMNMNTISRYAPGHLYSRKLLTAMSSSPSGDSSPVSLAKGRSSAWQLGGLGVCRYCRYFRYCRYSKLSVSVHLQVGQTMFCTKFPSSSQSTVKLSPWSVT